ncbi:MAG: hypothetical protein ACLR13_02730 [Acutalibacteraceae bacterium]
MFRLQTSIIAGCLTMAICVLPTIIRTTEEASGSSGSYKEGAYTGSRKIPCYYGNCFALRYAGRIDMVILAMGRIVGESAALLFTSGLSYNMPSGFFSNYVQWTYTYIAFVSNSKRGGFSDALNVALQQLLFY